MIINQNNTETLEKMHLHDMELLDVRINYCNHNAVILLQDEQTQLLELLFKGMQWFSISAFEPWGEGIYVSEVRTSLVNDEIVIGLEEECAVNAESFLTEVLLNSGDKIRVLSAEIHTNNM